MSDINDRLNNVMKNIPDPVQQAIWQVLKWVWETYGKDKAVELLQTITEKLGDAKWLQDLLELLKLNQEINWKKYIIVDNVCDPVCPGDRDCDGVPDEKDKCPDVGDQGCGVDENGCPIPCK